MSPFEIALDTFVDVMVAAGYLIAVGVAVAVAWMAVDFVIGKLKNKKNGSDRDDRV